MNLKFLLMGYETTISWCNESNKTIVGGYLMQKPTPEHRSGGSHLAMYLFSNMYMYVARAKTSSQGEKRIQESRQLGTMHLQYYRNHIFYRWMDMCEKWYEFAIAYSNHSNSFPVRYLLTSDGGPE